MCKMFVILHIRKERTKHEDGQLYLITHQLTIHTFNQAYLLPMLNLAVQLLKFPNQKVPSSIVY